MHIQLFILLIVTAYLVGSIPFALIIAALGGKDLRNIGSGNIGATNLARAMGRSWGYACFGLDAAKGALPALAACALYRQMPTSGSLLLAIAAGVAAILGHIFPLFARFRGGKGVATSFGVAIGFWPYYTVCAVGAFGVWLIVLFAWRYISLASVAGSAAFPIILVLAIAILDRWEFAGLWPLTVVAAAIPILVVFRHRGNIRRILDGTESRTLSGGRVSEGRSVE